MYCDVTRFLRLDSTASHHGFDNEIFPAPEFSRWIVTRNKKMQTGKKNEEDIFDRQFEILSSWNTIYLELRKEEISGGRRGFSSEEERSKRSVTARVTKFCRKSKIFLGYLCRLSINIETIETSGMPFPGRDKSLLDTWGKHQKCVSRHECSTRSKCIFAWTFTNTRNARWSVLAHISITINLSSLRKQKEAFPTPRPELRVLPLAIPSFLFSPFTRTTTTTRFKVFPRNVSI